MGVFPFRRVVGDIEHLFNRSRNERHFFRGSTSRFVMPTSGELPPEDSQKSASRPPTAGLCASIQRLAPSDCCLQWACLLIQGIIFHSRSEDGVCYFGENRIYGGYVQDLVRTPFRSGTSAAAVLRGCSRYENLSQFFERSGRGIDLLVMVNRPTSSSARRTA